MYVIRDLILDIDLYLCLDPEQRADWEEAHGCFEEFADINDLLKGVGQMSELTERLAEAILSWLKALATDNERLRAEVQSLKAGSGCHICDPTEVERLRAELAKAQP